MAAQMVNNEREITQKEEKMKELESTNNEQDKRLSYLQSSGFQLANFYFVFQGVILSASISGTSSLTCKDRWFLVVLSVLASVLNLFSLNNIGRNYLRCYVERDRTWAHRQDMRTELDGLKRPELASFKGTEQTNQVQSPSKSWDETSRKIYFFIGMGLFICFATIVVAGCLFIHCRKVDGCKGPISTDDKCIRLCEGARCISICPDY